MDWLLRFTQQHALDVVQEPLAVIHRDSRPSAYSVEQANLRIIEKYQADFLAHGTFYGRQCIGKRYLEIATHFYREGKRAPGGRYLIKALLQNPFQRPGMYLRIFDFATGSSLVKTLKRLRERLKWSGIERG
jgi:hypothetical protein